MSSLFFPSVFCNALDEAQVRGMLPSLQLVASRLVMADDQESSRTWRKTEFGKNACIMIQQAYAC